MAQLKIVVLIGTPVYLNYFVNRVAKDHKIQMVIRENVRANIFKKIKEKGIVPSLKIILKHLRTRAKYKADYNKVFGNQWKNINESIPYVEVDNINSPKVIQLLKELCPDVVIVQGTTLIKNKTIQNIPLVLNLHWGLSPYYKGSFCTEWALINKDIHNIGYTIHEITANIDGGAIYTQGRPAIENNDTVHSINMKLTKDGAAAMAQTLTNYAINKNLPMDSQDTSIGKLYLVKDWTPAAAARLQKAEKNMRDIIRHANPVLYPIIDKLSASKIKIDSKLINAVHER